MVDAREHFEAVEVSAVGAVWQVCGGEAACGGGGIGVDVVRAEAFAGEGFEDGVEVEEGNLPAFGDASHDGVEGGNVIARFSGGLDGWGAGGVGDGGGVVISGGDAEGEGDDAGGDKGVDGSQDVSVVGFEGGGVALVGAVSFFGVAAHAHVVGAVCEEGKARICGEDFVLETVLAEGVGGRHAADGGEGVSLEGVET